MKITLEGLIENLEKKNFNYDIDLVLEGGCMNGAYELGGLMLLKELEKKKRIRVKRLSGASVGSFVSLLYALDELECYLDSYKEWRDKFNETIQLENLERLLIKICSEMSDATFKSLQKNKLFITYYEVSTKRCILKKEYETRKELWESILKSCHLPYLINGKAFFKTEEGEYLDGGLPYIFKLQEENIGNKILYMKLARISKLRSIFNVSGEENIDGRVLEGLLDTYNFLMREKATEMCSFVGNWGLASVVRYNSINYIYWFGMCIFIYCHRFMEYILPSLEKIEIYKKLKPTGQKLYEDIVRYLVFS